MQDSNVLNVVPSLRLSQKMLFDYILGTLLLLVLAVPMICIAILIKFDSPGPIFFRQPRLGYRNEIFIIYKFRTMRHDNDRRSFDGSLQARRSDPRITRVGVWLRKYSIDEVPQLLNVMKGEMSIVGPRPHPINMQVDGRPLHDVVPNYPDRHRMLPGITGWAQVNGCRGEIVVERQIHERVAHDLYYIENWSLSFDIKILFFTVIREFVFSRNAY
jgi:lipopolysaccharide/colanic/teichoic acid biosynthesis glycosyltransferase